MYGPDVVLHGDFVARGDLRLREHPVADQHLHVLRHQHHLHGVRRGAQIQQAPLLHRLPDPGLVIAVAVEEDPLVPDDGLLDQFVQPGVKITLSAFQPVGELAQALRHRGVEHDVGTRDGVIRPDHPELKLVPRKGKGRGPVAVGGIPVEARQHVRAQSQPPGMRALIGGVLLDSLQHGAELVSEEDRDDGRRRLVCAQPVVVAGRGDAQAQQPLIVVHGLDDGHQKQQELCVLIGGLARAQQVDPGVRGQGPVVVLPAPVDPGEGLFMQQAHQVVLPGDLLHDLHHQLVVVRGDVADREDRGKLVLARGDLVVLGLGVDAQLPQLLVQVLHVRLYPRLDGAEIVVVQLLPLRRLGPEQGPPGIDQVLPLQVHIPVDEEVFLFRADVGNHALHMAVPEQMQHPQRLPVQRLHASQQGRFFIQRLPSVRAERSGDAEGLFLDKGIGGRVPCGIPSGFKGGAQAARGEAGRVRFPGDQLFSREFHDHVAVRRRREKAVVLFRRDSRERLEPVGKVGRPVRHRPGAHGVRHRIGNREVQLLAPSDGVLQIPVHVRRQRCPHDLVVKYHASEQFRNRLHGNSPFGIKIV